MIRCNFLYNQIKNLLLDLQFPSDKQEMVTPLGTTFSTDEQAVAQGDITYMGKTIESLVMEFDQAKYEEFLSSSSNSPKCNHLEGVNR